MKIWLLKKLGIWDFVWQKFCDEYPVRLSGKSPELKHYFSENEKAMTDMMLFGIGAIKFTINPYIKDKDLL